MLNEKINSLQGQIGVYYKHLSDGENYGFNDTEEFKPASVIKLPVVCAIYKMSEEGRADLSEKIKVKYDMRVPSCGAFNAFTDEPIVDIETLCRLAIVISDNTAANILIRRFGIDNLNKELESMGLVKTHVERCFFDDEMQDKGYENAASPKEIGTLLEQIYRGEFVNKTVSGKIMVILLDQQVRDLIPEYIETQVEVANKTGSARGITCDCAVVMGESPFVYVVLANETNVPETNDFIRKSAKALYEGGMNGNSF